MRVKVQIDAPHSVKLVAGRAVAIKVPKGAHEIELRLTPVQNDSFAKVLDVFFNGRKA